MTHTTGTLTVSQATGSITISDAEQTYDGSGQSVTVGTAGVNGESFAVTITYDGESDLPVDAGSYAVAVESNSPNYDASATGTLTISPAAATIVIGDLTAKYNGSGHEASVTVTPDVLIQLVTTVVPMLQSMQVTTRLCDGDGREITRVVQMPPWYF